MSARENKISFKLTFEAFLALTQLNFFAPARTKKLIFSLFALDRAILPLQVRFFLLHFFL